MCILYYFMKKINFIFLIFLLSSCGIFKDPKDYASDWNAQRLFKEAKGAQDVGDYQTAIKYYDMLQARYPFETYAQQAQLNTIYSYYKFGEPESAIISANHFIKLYPRHQEVDYVYYLKGLINFQLTQGSLERFLPLDRSQRDQRAALHAFEDFSDLIKRFPNSKYNADAKQRMIYLRNMLAQYELHVAKFYMVRQAYVAAINRAKTVIESYQGTPSVAEALVILAKAYKILGLKKLSNDAIQVLRLNYPNHKGISELKRVVVK
jgi:outer membrane protein assembly factor BamD